MSDVILKVKAVCEKEKVWGGIKEDAGGNTWRAEEQDNKLS